MTPLRFAILGKSQFASHLRRAMHHRDDIHVAYTWSLDQIAEFEEREWKAALDSARIDAVVLALPAGLAAMAAIQALRAGVHVLSELPGARSVEDIINLRQAERESGRVLKFGCSLRYHKSVRDAVALSATGNLGSLLTVRATYGHAGFPSLEARSSGILLNHGIHMLDLLHVFCGPFEAVKALRATGPGEIANTLAILQTGTGTTAQLHSSATSWRQTFRLELGFSDGYLWLDGHLPGLAGYGPEMLIHARLERDAHGAPVPNPDEKVTEYTSTSAAEDELADFLDAIAGQARLEHGSSQHAFDAMNIVQRIYAAAETWA